MASTTSLSEPTQSSSPGIGLPTERNFSGPWLQQQLVLTILTGLLSLAGFSLLVKRPKWRSYLAPIGRAPIVAEGEEPDADDRRLNTGKHARVGRLLNSMGLEWLATTIYTSDVAAAYLSGPPTSSIDTLGLLKFFRFGTKLFAYLSIWSLLILMPVNWRENGWLDGVRPGDDQKNSTTNATSVAWDVSLKKPDAEPLPVPPGGPSLPSFESTTLYDTTHLLTVAFFTFILLWLITKHTAAFLVHRQRILHSLHDTLASRSVMIRSVPVNLRSADALQAYFQSTLEMSAQHSWILPDVGMGVRKLLTQREQALRELEGAWVAWVGNPVRKDMRSEWKPRLIEARLKRRIERTAAGEEKLPDRGWRVGNRNSSRNAEEGISSEEGQALLNGTVADPDAVPPISSDASWGPPSFAEQRPTKLMSYVSIQSIDLLADLEIKFIKLDLQIANIRKKMNEGQWKTVGVGFVEFRDAKDALVASQSLYSEQPDMFRTVMAPDGRDLIWRNVGIPPTERRLRQLLISIGVTLLYLFYLPPLVFLGSLLSPAFLDKYIPGLYKLLSASPRLEALVSTSLPSLVLVGFNAVLPLLLEKTAVWQGVKTKSAVEMSVLKKYHMFLVTSVIFIFLITGTLFGILLDLSQNPMRLLDKFSLSLPSGRNFSLSYVLLQAFTVLPIQLMSFGTLLLSPFFVMAAKTPREHAEAHPAPIFKAGTSYPQALIVATLGLVYGIVKPLITVFAFLYFVIGYIIYKYKLLFVFYPPPSSTQQSMTAILRPRLIFAIFLFQTFQLSLFSVHGEVLLVLLTLPIMATTVWYGRFLDRRFQPLETYESLEGAIEADRAPEVAYRDAVDEVIEHEDREEPTQTSQGYGFPGQQSESRGHLHSSASFPQWPTDAMDNNEADEAEWGNDGFRTGASTPSTLDPNSHGRNSPMNPGTGRASASAKSKIWSPIGRLRRGRSSATHPLKQSSGDTASQDSHRGGRSSSSSRWTPQFIYHRPGSRYTNYREMASESGIESLPGLVDHGAEYASHDSNRRSSSLRRRDLDIDEEDTPGASGRTTPYSERDDNDDDGGDDDDGQERDPEEEQIGPFETYEHPAIRGRLKQLWLPGR